MRIITIESIIRRDHEDIGRALNKNYLIGLQSENLRPKFYTRAIVLEIKDFDVMVGVQKYN
jgi:hypothetical protein